VPLIFLVDTPGFMVGQQVERKGISRHGAKFIASMASAEVPKICVVVRKAYGAGYYAMSSPGFEPRATLAFPTAQIAAMGAEAAVNAMHAKRLSYLDGKERTDFLAAKLTEYTLGLGLERLASDLHVDAVVMPERMRAEIAGRLAAAEGWARRREVRYHRVEPA